MKKIVALVLSLVMVLGLATVAFAAAPANYYDVALTTAQGDANTNNYSLEAYTTGAAAAKTFDQVAIWATNKTTGAKVLVGDYVVAASAESADIAFVNGTVVTYLADVATYTADVKAVATIKTADAAKCGDVFVGLDAAAYTDANGAVYVESKNGTVYNVGGKAVKLAAATEVDVVVDDLATLTAAKSTVYTVVHDYAFETKTAANKTVVTKVVCAECKKEFAFLEGTAAEAIAKFGAGNFELVNGVYVAGSVASAPAAGETVESAKTFDAGIAMYVGMSVMAAAGSAVVLKKKD